jgi:hypothetical protein
MKKLEIKIVEETQEEGSNHQEVNRQKHTSSYQIP